MCHVKRMNKYRLGSTADSSRKTRNGQPTGESLERTTRSLVFRLLERFYDFHRDRRDASQLFQCDDKDVPFRLELPLHETIVSCLVIPLSALPFVLSERGRSLYWKICLCTTPLAFVWMHFFPPSRFHSNQLH
jgi:hypothetical protein